MGPEWVNNVGPSDNLYSPNIIKHILNWFAETLGAPPQRKRKYLSMARFDTNTHVDTNSCELVAARQMFDAALGCSNVLVAIVMHCFDAVRFRSR